MFKKLYEWWFGKVNPFSLDNIGEKQTPETNPSEPLPQPEETEYQKYRRERSEKIEEERKSLQQKLDDILLSETSFEIGDEVEYLKVPNHNVKFYVKQFNPSDIKSYYFSESYFLEKTTTHVQYFDSNNILHTIVDESKWFKKV